MVRAIKQRQRNVIASFYLLQITITVSFLFVAGKAANCLITRPGPDDAGADLTH